MNVNFQPLKVLKVYRMFSIIQFCLHTFVTIGVNTYMHLQASEATVCIQSTHFLHKNHKAFIFIK